MYNLYFRAWIGHKDDIDVEETKEFFEKSFESLSSAKMFINGEDCILWDEGEWSGHHITISFNPTPKIEDADGNVVAECVITDYDDYEFDWVDKE